MEETIWSGIGIILFVVAIIWLIVTLNRKINKALKKSAEILNFHTDIPRNILRKKKNRIAVEIVTKSKKKHFKEILLWILNKLARIGFFGVYFLFLRP